MIEKLHIVNFRNTVDITIEPSQYINLIEGNNGEGKSSIFYAIEYLLTDNLNEKISEYVRWGCDKFLLEMYFTFDNDNYYIKVEGEKSAKKELSINGELLYKNSEATKKLAEIINPNIIRYSSISEQGKTAQILFDTPANRLKKLKEILGIDKISDLCEEMKDEVNVKELEIKEADKEIKLLGERQYNFIDVPFVGVIDNLIIEKELLDKDKIIYEAQSRLYDIYTKDLSSYLNANKELEIYDVQIIKFKKQIEELEKLLKTVDSLDDIEKLNNQIIELEKEQIKQLNDDEKYVYKKDKIKKTRDGIVRNNELLNQYQLRRISPCKYVEDDLNKAIDNYHNTSFIIKQKQNEVLLAEQGKCPTCGQDFIADILKLNIEIQKLEKDKEEQEKIFSEIKKEITDYNKIVSEQETIKIQRKNIQDNIDNHQKELDELLIDFVEKELEVTFDFRKTIDSFKQKIKDYNETNIYNNKIKEQIKDLENKIETSIKLQEQYKYIKKPESIEEPIIYDKVKYEQLNKDIIIHEQKVAEKERILIYNAKIEKEKEDNQEKIKSLENELSLLKSLLPKKV